MTPRSQRIWIYSFVLLLALATAAITLVDRAFTPAPTISSPTQSNQVGRDSDSTSRHRHPSIRDRVSYEMEGWISEVLAGSGLPRDSVQLVLADSTRMVLGKDSAWIVDLSDLGIWWVPPFPREMKIPDSLPRYSFDLSGNAIGNAWTGDDPWKGLDALSPGWRKKQAHERYRGATSARAWLRKATRGRFSDSDIVLDSDAVVGLHVVCSDSAPHVAALGRLSKLRSLELVDCPLPISEQWMLGELPIDTLVLRNSRGEGALVLPARNTFQFVDVIGGDFRAAYLRTQDGGDVYDSSRLGWSLRLSGTRLCDTANIRQLALRGAEIDSSRCDDYPRQTLALLESFAAQDSERLETDPASGKPDPYPTPEGYVRFGYIVDTVWWTIATEFPSEKGIQLPTGFSSGAICHEPTPYAGLGARVIYRGFGPWWVVDGDSAFVFGAFPKRGPLRRGMTRQQAKVLLGPPMKSSPSILTWHADGGDEPAELHLHFDRDGKLDRYRIFFGYTCPC